MNFKFFLSKPVTFFAVLLCFSTINLYSQTVPPEKKGSVAAYVTDKEEEASGLTRKRTVPAENVRIIYSVKPSANEVLDFEKQVFSLINQKRAEQGLPALVWSNEVAKIARLHSENMVKFNFFSHRGVDGKAVDGRADSLGITRWTLIGENIAYNRGYQNPVEMAVEKWMLSATHRQNLLNDRWKETAIGIAVAADGTYFFTQVFLKRK